MGGPSRAGYREAEKRSRARRDALRTRDGVVDLTEWRAALRTVVAVEGLLHGPPWLKSVQLAPAADVGFELRVTMLWDFGGGADVPSGFGGRRARARARKKPGCASGPARVACAIPEYCRIRAEVAEVASAIFADPGAYPDQHRGGRAKSLRALAPRRSRQVASSCSSSSQRSVERIVSIAVRMTAVPKRVPPHSGDPALPPNDVCPSPFACNGVRRPSKSNSQDPALGKREAYEGGARRRAAEATTRGGTRREPPATGSCLQASILVRLRPPALVGLVHCLREYAARESEHRTALASGSKRWG
jgi:hypothetical protein